MNIKCPVASYDANVEPAKDDILFGSESLVLELAENLLKEVYGECSVTPTLSIPRMLAKKRDDFELLLARKSPPSENLPPMPLPQQSLNSPAVTTLPASSSPAEGPPATEEILFTEAEENVNQGMSNRSRTWEFDMSRDYSEEVEDVHRPSWANKPIRPSPRQTPDRETSALESLNPRIIARLTAPCSRDLTTSANTLGASCRPAVDVSSLTQARSDQLGDSDIFVSPSTRPRQTFRGDDIRALQSSVVTPSRQHRFDLVV